LKLTDDEEEEVEQVDGPESFLAPGMIRGAGFVPGVSAVRGEASTFVFLKGNTLKKKKAGFTR
jgi:hypothetical protein